MVSVTLVDEPVHEPQMLQSSSDDWSVLMRGHSWVYCKARCLGIVIVFQEGVEVISDVSEVFKLGTVG